MFNGDNLVSGGIQMTKRVVIYTRVSTEEQAREGHSLEAQYDICAKFASSRDWKVVGHYEDKGYSGRSDRRPSFQNLMAGIRAGQFDIILTHKLDRLSRNLLDIKTWLQEFDRLGVAYESAVEDFDLSTPVGKLHLNIMGSVSEWYLDNLSQEISKGKQARAKKGLWNGDPPFGYERVHRGSLRPNRDAEGVKLAFEKYASGQSTDGQIAGLLNDQGFRTANKTGRRRFAKDSIRTLLQNPFYTGQVASYRGVKRKPQELYPGQHEAIISQEIFSRCQEVRLKRNAGERGKAPGHARTYPASGTLFCWECGTRYRGQNAHGERRYYDPGQAEYRIECRQPKLVDASAIEEELGGILGDISLPDDWRQNILRQVNRYNPEDNEQKRRQLQAQLERAKQLFIQGDLTGDEYKTEKMRVHASLSRLQPVTGRSLIDAGELLSDFSRIWGLANLEERKRLLRASLEAAYIEKSAITAVKPRPEFYNLIYRSGGPDGIRTRDLCLDRAAC